MTLIDASIRGRLVLPGAQRRGGPGILRRGLEAIALLAIVGVAVLSCGAPARADEEADHRAAAVALLDQLHPADAVNAMMPSIIQQIRLNTTHNDPDLLKVFNGFAPQLAAEGEAAKSDLLDRIVDIYAKTFTTDELKLITTFYQSAPGQKMIGTQAQVTTDTVQAVRDWGTKLANHMAEEARAKLQAPQP